MLGSTTEHLTHHAQCPVIVIPSPAVDTTGPRSAAEPPASDVAAL